MRLKVLNVADKSLFDNLFNAEEIAVPAAVVEDRKQPLFLLRQRNQLALPAYPG
jgi:hypothetical protein